MADADKPNKGHKKKQSGVKANKKKEKGQEGKVEKHNPKAHSFSGGKNSVRKRVQYQADRAIRKDRAPKVDKTPDVPPPFVVVVQGPPGVGKSTLIKSLVKHYARQRLLELRGPVTLVSGRQRRITIVECPQDMSAMLDLAKVADLALLVIDASFGFELETFEFISIMQTHGFPRVIGVLTHLDCFKDNKQLRKIKKTMKHRFWTEIYDGSKLFYLSGLQYGRYNRLEIQNLARFVAVQKTPILSWRSAHPYTLGLRWEDQTPPQLPAHEPRTLDVYGYVYGGRLREGSQVHLAGAGDFTISAIKALIDPCPPPQEVDADRIAAKGKDGKKPKKTNALRTLAERHRVIYAPGSDVGSISLDADAMYIQVPEHAVGFTAREGEKDEELPEAVRMVRQLQGGDLSLDSATGDRSELRLIGQSKIHLKESTDRPARRLVPSSDINVGRKHAESQEDADDEEEDDEEEEEEDVSENELAPADLAESDPYGLSDVLERAKQRFESAPRLEALVYGGLEAVGRRAALKGNKGPADGPTDHQTIPLFDDEEAQPAARNPLQTSTELLGNLGDAGALDTSRMPELPGREVPWDEEKREEVKSRKFITGGWSSAEENSDAEPEVTDAAVGDANEAEASKPPNDGLSLFENFADGVPIATFVRIRLEGVPAACVAEMKKEKPLLLGGLLPGESQMGMVQLRIKRHRWHPKLLKSNDALLMSVGWRRFQTVPIYSLEDRGEKRMRFLKYSLEHAHCHMTCWAPTVPPNTGVAAFRSFKSVTHFRVAATANVLEVAPSFEIKKKLKLQGEPYKIFKNTAFIRGMFNSDLEVSKYLHTKIQTVSGIRGEIKKPEGTRGHFRATFEDRILASDIVACKCWINIEPRKFYHPVVDVAGWRAARLIGEIRANSGVPVPHKADSSYGAQIVRPARKFNPLRISKNLEASLPFKTKPKLQGKKVVNPLRRQTAIVPSAREKEANSLLVRLHTVRNEKYRLRKQANTSRKDTKEKREKFIADKREQHGKDNRKKRYMKAGMEEGKKRKAMALE